MRYWIAGRPVDLPSDGTLRYWVNGQPYVDLGAALAALQATATVQVKVKAQEQGATSLRAQTEIQIKAKALSKTAMPLLGRITEQVKARVGQSQLQALASKITAMVKAYGLSKVSIPLAAKATMQIKARGTVGRILAIFGRATVALKGRGFINLGPVHLRGIIAIKTWLRAVFQPHCDVVAFTPINPLVVAKCAMSNADVPAIVTIIPTSLADVLAFTPMSNGNVIAQVVMCCVC